MAYSKDNNIFFICFVYSVLYAIGFRNCFNNPIKLVIHSILLEFKNCAIAIDCEILFCFGNSLILGSTSCCIECSTFFAP